jgi:hypothetical protein
VSHIHLALSSCAAANQDLLVRSEWRGVDLRVAHRHGALGLPPARRCVPGNQPFGQERADLAGVGVSCAVVQPEHQMAPVVLSIVSKGRVHCWNATHRDALDALSDKEAIRDKLVDHTDYICGYGDDMPAITRWRWGHEPASAAIRQRPTTSKRGEMRT